VCERRATTREKRFFWATRVKMKASLLILAPYVLTYFSLLLASAKLQQRTIDTLKNHKFQTQIHLWFDSIICDYKWILCMGQIKTTTSLKRSCSQYMSYFFSLFFHIFLSYHSMKDEFHVYNARIIFLLSAML